MNTRRNILKGAAWSVPVIAVAVAAPQASASVSPEPEPFNCVKVRHGGAGGHQWVGIFSDGTKTITMSNAEAMSGPFGAICRAYGDGPGAGDYENSKSLEVGK